jgi:aldose 1-epimerase
MRYQLKSSIALSLALITFACSSSKKDSVEETPPLTIKKFTKATFGMLPDGKEVSRFTLRNSRGIEVSVINYGGIITSLLVPDKNGVPDDVVLGYDSLTSYVKSSPYFGALIGRYGNRIGNGKFKIDGKEYSLPLNDGPNHLHGGIQGFDKVFWDVQAGADSTSLSLTYKSVDGEQGYPGNLDIVVRYSLTENNELKIDYKAVTDKKTIINLTQHSYFNLAGSKSKTILEHDLMIAADAFLPVDKTLIPTGEVKKVEGTPFDFRQATKIGRRIEDKNEQLTYGRGYDHCWVLNNSDGTLRSVATLSDSLSGRVMEVYTTEPGLQFYSGNFLDGTLTGKGGARYNFRSGLCLETQHYPDSPNKKNFPNVFLSPGETYQSTTVYKFK